MNEVDMRNELRTKLTRRKTSYEVFGAMLTAILIFIVGYAALQLSGLIAVGLWIMFGLQIIGSLMKAAGWRSITLTNDEQDFLKQNYTL